MGYSNDHQEMYTGSSILFLNELKSAEMYNGPESSMQTETVSAFLITIRTLL